MFVNYYKQLLENFKTIRIRGEVYIMDNHNPNIIYVGVKPDGKISIPGGGIDLDENIIDGVKREALEEIAVKVKNLKLLKKPINIKFDKQTTDYKNGKHSSVDIHSYIGIYNGIDRSIIGEGPEGELKLLKIEIDELLALITQRKIETKQFRWKQEWDQNIIDCLTIVKGMKHE